MEANYKLLGDSGEIMANSAIVRRLIACLGSTQYGNAAIDVKESLYLKDEHDYTFARFIKLLRHRIYAYSGNSQATRNANITSTADDELNGDMMIRTRTFTTL